MGQRRRREAQPERDGAGASGSLGGNAGGAGDAGAWHMDRGLGNKGWAVGAEQLAQLGTQTRGDCKETQEGRVGQTSTDNRAAYDLHVSHQVLRTPLLLCAVRDTYCSSPDLPAEPGKRISVDQHRTSDTAASWARHARGVHVGKGSGQTGGQRSQYMKQGQGDGVDDRRPKCRKQ